MFFFFKIVSGLESGMKNVEYNKNGKTTGAFKKVNKKAK